MLGRDVAGLHKVWGPRAALRKNIVVRAALQTGCGENRMQHPTHLKRTLLSTTAIIVPETLLPQTTRSKRRATVR